MTGPELDPLHDIDAVRQLARRVYEDPANRAATGWFDEADKEDAIQALVGLWERRFEAGWSVHRILADDRLIGLAGHGPFDEPDHPPGLAVYLLEAGRGRGWGTAIAQRLVDQARTAGVETMETVAHAENTASHTMLERVGFQATGPCTAEWAVESDQAWTIFVNDLDG